IRERGILERSLRNRGVESLPLREAVAPVRALIVAVSWCPLTVCHEWSAGLYSSAKRDGSVTRAVARRELRDSAPFEAARSRSTSVSNRSSWTCSPVPGDSWRPLLIKPSRLLSGPCRPMTRSEERRVGEASELGV